MILQEPCYNGQVDCVLTLDIGSSSARTLLFDFNGRQIPGFGSQIVYRAQTTPDGGWEIDPSALIGMVTQSIDAICGQMRAKGIKPAAVAVDTFWHSILGVDAEGNPTTAILHAFDTRSAAAAQELARRIDNTAQHSRTGCVLHPSYPPARILWLAETQAAAFRKTKSWMSAGEYLFLKLLGRAAASTSMLSASGLWNQNANDYDPELLSALPIAREQLAAAATRDQPVEAKCQWAELSGIPWFPALGDGACDNIGSGCTGKDRFALMVGTSGAMRAVVEAPQIQIPDGLFCYRVDGKRFVLGGALSNGGEVFAWMKRTLRLPDSNDEIEKQLAALTPASHGLTILPLFAGERSPGWRADASAAIAGLRSHTSPIEILRASLEGVAMRFRSVYALMKASLGKPREVIASGGALLHSATWTQIMADTLPHAVIPCLEPETTSRGAALLALERLGVAPAAGSHYGQTIEPVDNNTALYMAAAERQQRLYMKLFEEPQ
ncbi:MAG: gluconokinase [Acidobacteriota bacterium]|nr:gluconokinase [Acidobacteriota bacterium]